MFAQSLVEYGALSSSKSPFAEWVSSAQDWVANSTPTTWMVLAGILAFALIVVRSRRS